LDAVVTGKDSVVSVVDRRADDVPALRAQDDGELVGERGLAGGGRPVDGDPRRVRGRDGSDHLSQTIEELVAGPVVHALPPSVWPIDSLEPPFENRNASGEFGWPDYPVRPWPAPT
jgi:hypothetical protein